MSIVLMGAGGTITGTVSGGTGSLDSSLSFDGSTDYLAMDDAVLTVDTSCTRYAACFGYKFSSDQTGNIISFHSVSRLNYTTSSTPYAIRIQKGSTEKLTIRGYNAGATLWVAVSTESIPATASAWNSIYVVYDSTQAVAADRIKAYLNGVALTMSFSSGSIGLNDTLYTLDSQYVVWGRSGITNSSGSAVYLWFPGNLYRPGLWVNTANYPTVSQIYSGGQFVEIKNNADLTSLAFDSASTSPTEDHIQATDWTNGGTVTIDTSIVP